MDLNMTPAQEAFREEVRSFVQHRFATRDSASLQYQALKLYQVVLRLHQNEDGAWPSVPQTLHHLDPEPGPGDTREFNQAA